MRKEIDYFFHNPFIRLLQFEVAMSTPSKQLAEFLRDLSGVMETTKDIIVYLENRLITLNITRTIYYGFS